MVAITIGAGGPDVEFENGTYPVTVKGLAEKTITPKSGPNANTEVEVYDWTFDVDAGEVEFEASGLTSKMTGPQSKTVAFITALLGEAAIQTGATFELGDLIGKRALAAIEADANGWPKVKALLPLPKSMRAAVTAPASSPEASATSADAEGDDLPF